MSSPPVIIRQALQKDLDDLVLLLELLFALEEDFQPDRQKQRAGLSLLLTVPGGLLLVAVAGDLVVGMCSGQTVISTAEGGPALLVEDLVILPDWRGAGIGRKLLDGLGGRAQAMGIARMQLLADSNNSDALEFYRRLGWQTTQLVCLRKHS